MIPMSHPNGHGKCAALNNETRIARFPLSSSLPQAGERGSVSLREFHVNRCSDVSKRLLAGLLGVVLLLTHAGMASAAANGNPSRKIALGAGEGSIAVIYPDIGEPYHTVFAQIIGGIENQAKVRYVNFAMAPNVDVNELKNFLRQQNVRVVIALGMQGMKIAITLDRDIGVVIGGVITSPENSMRELPVNSLSPDPALLFSHLKALMPDVRRVFVVCDPRQNAWLMRQAKQAALSQKLELVIYEAQDLHGAVHAYQEILAEVDNHRDALWLPHDSTTVEDSGVLPLVLHESWSRNLAVFSSSLGHVRRGVLFSLYPDNAALGRHLGETAQEFWSSGDYGEHGMILLHEVLLAVNLRTAMHLGIDTGNQPKFDMVFPEK